MDGGVYKFSFREDVPAKQIEESLLWAAFNSESIFGRAKFRLDCSFHFDRYQKVVIIDKSTDAGKHLAQLFTSIISRECGDESFRIERLLAKGMRSPTDSTTKES